MWNVDDQNLPFTISNMSKKIISPIYKIIKFTWYVCRSILDNPSLFYEDFSSHKFEIWRRQGQNSLSFSFEFCFALVHSWTFNPTCQISSWPLHFIVIFFCSIPPFGNFSFATSAKYLMEGKGPNEHWWHVNFQVIYIY